VENAAGDGFGFCFWFVLGFGHAAMLLERWLGACVSVLRCWRVNSLCFFSTFLGKAAGLEDAPCATGT
jgi:hypothetical protein